MGILSGTENSITAIGDGGKPVTLNTSDLDKMSHAEIARLRHYNEDNPQTDKQLAPFEHQAFAREWTKEMPYVAVPSLAVATPIYAAAKSLGVDVGVREIAKTLGLIQDDGKQRAATPAALDQIKHGYRGILQGLGMSD